jgi:hypothetical protein
MLIGMVVLRTWTPGAIEAHVIDVTDTTVTLRMGEAVILGGFDATLLTKQVPTELRHEGARCWVKKPKSS